MKQTRIQRSTKPMRADNSSVHPQDASDDPPRKAVCKQFFVAEFFHFEAQCSYFLSASGSACKHLCRRHAHNAPLRYPTAVGCFLLRHAITETVGDGEFKVVKQTPLTQNQLKNMKILKVVFFLYPDLRQRKTDVL